MMDECFFFVVFETGQVAGGIHVTKTIEERESSEIIGTYDHYIGYCGKEMPMLVIGSPAIVPRFSSFREAREMEANFCPKCFESISKAEADT